MNQEEINKRNEAIALFMGREIVLVKSVECRGIDFWMVKGDYPRPFTTSYSKEEIWENHCGEAKYHSSWDWMLPACKKMSDDLHRRFDSKDLEEWPVSYLLLEDELLEYNIEGVFEHLSDLCLTLKKD